jgi:hypothetical protein
MPGGAVSPTPRFCRGSALQKSVELAAGVRPGLDDAGAGGVQDPQRLPVPTLAGRGQVHAG